MKGVRHNSRTNPGARNRVTVFAVLNISERHICGLSITSLLSAARMASLAVIVCNRRESGSPDAPMGHRGGPMGLPDMTFGLRNVRCWLIRPVPAPAPGCCGEHRGGLPALRPHRPDE